MDPFWDPNMGAILIGRGTLKIPFCPPPIGKKFGSFSKKGHVFYLGKIVPKGMFPQSFWGTREVGTFEFYLPPWMVDPVQILEYVELIYFWSGAKNLPKKFSTTTPQMGPFEAIGEVPFLFGWGYWKVKGGEIKSSGKVEIGSAEEIRGNPEGLPRGEFVSRPRRGTLLDKSKLLPRPYKSWGEGKSSIELPPFRDPAGSPSQIKKIPKNFFETVIKH